jgi:cysteine desulfurase/selenocysteine lyase
MIDTKKIRQDFPMFKNYPLMQGKRFCYLDNAATTFKPYSVIKAGDAYYESFTANSNRGDYDLAHTVDVEYEKARETVARFINAKPQEVAFTSGDSMSMNMIAYGLSKFLNEGDEVLLSEAEHASNVLPWFAVCAQKKAHVSYVPLTQEGRLTSENLEKSINSHTKIVSLAHVTNVLGFTLDVKALAAIAHKHHCYFVVDGAQSVPHLVTDVKDIDCDFLAFSGHKMLGPTGIGVLYGKYELLEKIDPLLTGGGMNSRFQTCGNVTYQIPPAKFEAGTQNLSGAIGLAAACDYLTKIGLDNIREHETYLRNKIIEGLEGLDNIIIYNKNADSGIITFNVKNVFAQDAASLLNSKGVAVRSGQHCAKILTDFLKTDATIRASLYLYNDDEDAEQFVAACKNGGDFLDAYFN